MDTNLKYKLVEKIIQTEDDGLLNEVKLILGVTEDDFWFTLPEPVKQAINKAKTELDNGEGIPHQQVMEEVKRILET